MTVLGIDVSHYQGNVDWHAVSRSDVRFAYIKATEGGSAVDAMFQGNWIGARDAGLPRGAYHFAHPDQDADAQAVHFASIVGPPTWGELAPVLDLEVMGGLSAEGVVRWALAFMKKAEALLGRPLMLYTGGLWRNQLGDPIVPELKTRLLWLARYAQEEPVVPKNWARWDFWQFTDGQNGEVIQVPGVRGRCDCNRFRGDLTELQALQTPASGPAVVPPEPAEPRAPGLPPWPGEYFVWPHQPPIQGDHVRAWQARLRDRGFTVTADGVYGSESKTACIAFQREAGLTPDGIVGQSTWDSTFDH
jgi:lysozyme